MLTLNIKPAAEAFFAKNDRTLFSKLTTDFETAVTRLLSQDEVSGISRATLEAFQKSYASTAFRCRFPNCPRSSIGFPSSKLRTEHEAAHLRRVYCKIESCQWGRIGFKNKNGLDAHARKHHGEKPTLPIPPKVRRSQPPNPDQPEQQRAQELPNPDQPGQLPAQGPPNLVQSGRQQAQGPPNVDSEILKHVQGFKYYLRPGGPKVGTPEGDQKIKEYKSSYMMALTKQSRAASRIKMTENMIKQYQSNGRDIPPEVGLQRQQMQREYESAREYIENFRKQQATLRQVCEERVR